MGNQFYIKETDKSFDEAVVAVLGAVEQKGWAVFQIYDMKERLAAKGFKHGPLKIIEICNARHSNKLLERNKLVSLCMPCRINIFEEDGKVKIAVMRPIIMLEFFPEIKKEDVEELEKDIMEIVENAG